MNIGFVASSLNNSVGSTRIWVSDLNDYFTECSISSVICKNNDQIRSRDILICSKSDAQLAVRLKQQFPEKKIGVINLSAAAKVKNIDFVIVGSLEEKDSLSHHENVFLFPLIEKMMQGLELKKHINKDKLVIGYHGSWTHLAKFENGLQEALEELDEILDIELRIITGNPSFNWKVGRPNIKNVVYKQWNINTICSELKDCDIGIVPNITKIVDEQMLSRTSVEHGLYDTDYMLRFKNKSNAGRSFVFHQLGIPVIADMTPSNFHILGDEACGLLAHSKNGWKKSILKLTDHKSRQRIARNAKREFDRLYNPHAWAKRLYAQIQEI